MTVQTNCNFCKKIIIRKYPYMIKGNNYCNSSCQMKHEYKEKLRDPQKITEEAHETLRTRGHYKRDNSYLSDNHISEEKRKEISVKHSGTGNPMYGKRGWNYKGPTIKTYMKHVDWKRARKLALIRDNFICQACGMEHDRSMRVYKTPLNVHHIIPFRVCKEHKLDNLITLCCSCHSKITVIESKTYKMEETM